MREPLHAPQRQVPLPALQSAHISPVKTQHLSESLLRETQLEADTPEVLSHRPLQIPLGHICNRSGLLLEGLHTYK